MIGVSYNTAFGLLISLLRVCQIVHSDLFSAMVDLEQVFYAEHFVAEDLRRYISQEEKRLEILKRLADNYEAHSIQALRNPEHHLANPVEAFLLVKRFTTDWQSVLKQYIVTNASSEFLESLKIYSINFPQDEDLTGAAAALLRLQDTYSLSTKQIAQGNLLGVLNSPQLTAEECFELGRHAYIAEDYNHSMQWMSEAYSRLEQEDPPTIKHSDILDYLAYISSMQGNIQQALNFTLEFLKIDPNNERVVYNKKYYEDILEDEVEEKKRVDEQMTYVELCRGEKVKEVPDEHKLKCQLKRHHPMFYLDPLREETLHLDPWLVVYHNVLTDTQMAKIKELAMPRLNRATVQNPVTGKLEAAAYRVSKSAWLDDEDDPIIKRISLKTAAIANLTLDTVEPLQVVNYGIGGQYDPHYDFGRSEEEVNTFFTKWHGNRILTAIYYLSEVSAGGFTVFTDLGVKVEPIKASLALWYNLLPSGEGDYRTKHAACPVLIGSKWVANKWFHVRGQEFKRPCSLNELD